MYRTLTNPKFLRRLPHRSLCFYNILCNLNRPFFDIIFQGKIPRTHCFYNVCGGLQLYCSCKLAHIKCCVFSLLFHQFLMVSNFFDIAIFHIKNHICITDGRQPMGYDETGTSFHKFCHCLLKYRNTSCKAFILGVHLPSLNLREVLFSVSLQ